MSKAVELAQLSRNLDFNETTKDINLGGGLVVINTGDNTDVLGEGSTNLYYTNTRARAAISATGSLSYNNTTGVISFTETPYTAFNTDFDTRLGTKDTDDLGEGTTNLYYTDTRADARADVRIAAADTDDLSEGSTNLYYTDGRVSTYLTTNTYATQTYVTTQISNLVAAAPGALDTLNELAAAIGDDANFAGTVTTSLANKISRTTDDTDALSEGATNLYFTTSRVQGVVSQSYVNGLNVNADTVDNKHYDDIIGDATALAIALG